MALTSKKILITAGPTWVPIDSVRVISNIASGETGALLAGELVKRGASVTLLLGPVESRCLDKKIKVIRFKFFDELKKRLLDELKKKKYDIVIHSAAAADYKPERIATHKIRSGIKVLRIKLVPTEKLIDLIKKIDRSIYLVGFKFEPQGAKKKLIKSARKLMGRCGADSVVVNSIYKNRYQAFILGKGRVQGPFRNKALMVKYLISGEPRDE